MTDNFNNHLPTIEKIFVYIAKDDEGNEGIAGYLGPNGWLPMIYADTENARLLKPIAKLIAERSGQKITLYEFTMRSEIEVI